MKWSKLTLAVVGGDEREQEIARLAAETGAEVRGYGFPWPDAGIQGVARCENAADAFRGADYGVFPIPGIALDGSLYAPAANHPIVPDEALLGELGEGGTVIIGKADAHLAAAARAARVNLVEYESDQELMQLRAPAIVEGALEITIALTDLTIHAASIVVVGYGNIGALLARALTSLGARVSVAARNPVQRAAAFAAGAHPLPLDDLPAHAPEFAMVFSTVPAPVVGRSVLERLPPGTLVMDLAAPPGGVDLALARELGHRAVWARGLGRRAPITVGRVQWLGIRRRIEAIERQAG